MSVRALDDRPRGAMPARRVQLKMPWATSFLQGLVLACVIGGWQIAADVFDTTFWTSSPTLMAKQFHTWSMSGELASALGVTLAETLLGFLLGALVGAALGFALGWFPLAGDILEPIILPFYALPKVALAPLFVLIFGIGLLAKTMLVALMVFFIVFFVTFSGARAVDRELLNISYVMGASKLSVWRKIAVPHSAIWIMSALRLALPSAFHGAVVGEFIAASNGVGFLIRKSTATFNTTGVMTGVLVLLVVAALFLSAVRRIESHILRWQPTARHD